MIKTVQYSKVEKIEYSFDEYDIYRALIDYFKIETSDDYDVQVYEGKEETRPHIEIIINFMNKVEKPDKGLREESK